LIMISGIADTHTIIWYTFSDVRLSAKAKTFISQVAATGNQIGLSSITLVEIVYLMEKNRLLPQTYDRIIALLDEIDGVFQEIPLDRQVAEAMKAIDRAKVPDMPDRIIAATAILYKVPVISKDNKIQASSVTTIW